MLLIYIALIVPIAFILMVFRRDRGSVLTFFTALSLSEFIFFVLMFIAKHRGFEKRMVTVFFLNARMDQQLRYTIILLSQLGYGIALGRCLFPLFLLLLAVEHTTVFSQRQIKLLYGIAPVLPLLTLIGYIRPVFEWLSGRSAWLQHVFVQFSFGWCVAYTLMAVTVCLYELFSTAIRHIRRRYLQKVVMLLGFAGIYLLYCRQDPAQAYMFYQDSYMAGLGLWYLSPIMSYSTHLIMIALLFACTITSTVYMVRVGVINIRLQQDVRNIRQKFDMARHGGNVFVHGIKNQLLAGQALCKRMESAVSEDVPNVQALRGDIARMQDTINAMMAHVNSLYSAFREPTLHFAPTDTDTIIEMALSAVYTKYPQAHIEVGDISGYELTADSQYLTEALVNLIMNAWEANLLAGRESAPVRVRCYPSSTYVVIEIADCGQGIPKSKRRKIFEPFFTEKNTNQNWGMGLYLSHMIVRRHFGQLEVSSTVNKGTTLYMMLPMYRHRKEKMP